MTMVAVRSANWATVTLQDGTTTVGAVPIFLDTASQNYQQGIAQSKIVEVSNEVFELANALANVQQQTGLTGSNITNKVYLANAVALTSTTAKFYDLIQSSGLAENVIRQYHNFKISFYSTLAVAIDVTVYDGSAAGGVTNGTSAQAIYSGTNVLAANTYLTLSPFAGGTGVGAGFVSVPALQGVHSNLIVKVTPETAPTSGAITVMVEMN